MSRTFAATGVMIRSGSPVSRVILTSEIQRGCCARRARRRGRESADRMFIIFAVFAMDKAVVCTRLVP